MIDYIKYTIDNVAYNLLRNEDGTWTKEATAPSVAGNYDLIIEISENGIITYIDASDPKYNLYLDVIAATERIIFLENYCQDFINQIPEFKTMFEAENIKLDEFYSAIEKMKSDRYIETASNDAITRLENFIGIKGQGSLKQRKNFLFSLLKKGNKLSETTIKNITNAITGSDCIVNFFGSDEINNPYPGYGLLRVQVLSPDNYKDYRYEDIQRTLSQLTPSHIKLLVMKYFSTWADIKNNYADWNTIASQANWKAVRDYIPPQ
jgi:hypothetical protein